MAEKEMKIILKVLGIIGVIFCLVALLVPWSNNVFTFGFFSEIYSTPFFVDFFINQDYHSVFGIGQIIFFGIAMIIIFIITLITLLLGVFAIKSFERTPPNKYLNLGILLIVNVVLYIIAVSMLTSAFGMFGGIGLGYGIGFVMCIIAAILFFIIYSIEKTYMPQTSFGAHQQPMYQQQPHVYSQPQQAPPPHHPAPPPLQSDTSQQVGQDKNAKKFCSSCGSKLTPNAKFCSGCGQKV
jgi:hypothetical protein